MARLSTLVAEAARIDVHGVPQLEDLTLDAASDRIGLAGDWTALFDAIGQRAAVIAGELRLLGEPATSAAGLGVVGLARCDPPLPPKWTFTDYVVASARLAGYTKREARAATRDVVERLGLGGLADRRLSTLTPVERRALAIAHASVTSPPVLAVETPLAALDPADEDWVLALLGHAAEDRRLLVSVARTPAQSGERRLLDGCDEVAMLASGALVAHGAPSEVLGGTTRYVVTVTRHGDDLARALADKGFAVEHAGGDANGAGRFLVVLPDGTDTGPVLDAALELEAPVVELVPV